MGTRKHYLLYLTGFTRWVSMNTVTQMSEVSDLQSVVNTFKFTDGYLPNVPPRTGTLPFLSLELNPSGYHDLPYLQ